MDEDDGEINVSELLRNQNGSPRSQAALNSRWDQRTRSYSSDVWLEASTDEVLQYENTLDMIVEEETTDAHSKSRKNSIISYESQSTVEESAVDATSLYGRNQLQENSAKNNVSYKSFNLSSVPSYTKNEGINNNYYKNTYTSPSFKSFHSSNMPITPHEKEDLVQDRKNRLNFTNEIEGFHRRFSEIRERFSSSTVKPIEDIERTFSYDYTLFNYDKLSGIQMLSIIGRVSSILNGSYLVADEEMIKMALSRFKGKRASISDYNDKDYPSEQSKQMFYRYIDEENHNCKIWLEYLPKLKRWQFKPEIGLKRDLCYGYIDSKDGNLLVANTSRSIELWTGRGKGSWFTEMPQVKIIQSSETYSGFSVKGILVSGFTGQFKHKLNGFYITDDDLLTEQPHEDSESEYDSDSNYNDSNDTIATVTEDLPRYKKADNHHAATNIDCWLEYNYEHHAWQFKPYKSLTFEKCWAYFETNGRPLFPYHLNREQEHHQKLQNGGENDVSWKSFKNISSSSSSHNNDDDDGNNVVSSNMNMNINTARSNLTSGSHGDDDQDNGDSRNGSPRDAFTDSNNNNTNHPNLPRKLMWYAKDGFQKQHVIISNNVTVTAVSPSTKNTTTTISVSNDESDDV